MNKNLNQELIDRFPKIFTDKSFFLEINDGWYNIIDKLCGNIQSHIDWRIKSRETLLENNPHNFPIPPEIPQVVAVQVKEKFGGLRFYYNGGDEYIRGVISMAESMSYVICEKCGKNGERRSTGWIKTLCNEHFKEFNQNKKDQ
jgi:hypothetical protein